MTRIRLHLGTGEFRFSMHALQRLDERGILQTEVFEALKSGRHEKKKDQFDEDFGTWNYAVLGKTLDKRVLRVVVSFTEEGTLVITVIDLD